MVAGSVSYLADGTAFSEAYGDVYHSAAGALGQAGHVFLSGNDLPQRWAGRRRFTIVETGFGTGLNFLATWLAWRKSRSDSARLHFVSFEQHPLLRQDLIEALRRHQCADTANATAHSMGQETDPDAADRAALAPLADALVEAWPPVLTRGMHRLSFDDDRIVLTLVFGDAYPCASQLRLRADAFYLDGFAPSRNPAMWQPRLFKALARLADEEATVATYTSAGQVRRDLADAGFAVRRAPGFAGKRSMTVGHFAPRWRVRRHPPPTASFASADKRSPDERNDTTSIDAAHCPSALIVGAGVAGCAVTDQLIRRGWRVTLIDRADQAASGASGNPAGIFHPVVTRDEGRATRWSRAAFLYGLRYWRSLDRRSHHAAGKETRPLRWSDAGLVQRIAQDIDIGASTAIGTETAATLAAEEEAGNLSVAPGLPLAIAERIPARTVEALTGMPVGGDAWWFKEGGWIDPRSLIEQMLGNADTLGNPPEPVTIDRTDFETAMHAGNRLVQRYETPVARLSRDAGQWCAHHADGRIIARADVVVLANASDAARLADTEYLPTEPVRGQLTVFPLNTRENDGKSSDAVRSLQRLKLPLIGGAYAIPLPAGVPIGQTAGHDVRPSDEAGRSSTPTSGPHLLTGASYQVGVSDTSVTDAEHRENLVRLATLLDQPLTSLSPVLSARRVFIDAKNEAAGETHDSDATPVGDAVFGRAAVRCVTGDRMPFVGQLPDSAAAIAKATAFRGAHLADLPRMPGLFGVFGLGSRGILWSALAAECIANLIEGEPTPIESDLLDAMDPARFLLRQLRRQSD